MKDQSLAETEDGTDRQEANRKKRNEGGEIIFRFRFVFYFLYVFNVLCCSKDLTPQQRNSQATAAPKETKSRRKGTNIIPKNSKKKKESINVNKELSVLIVERFQ